MYRLQFFTIIFAVAGVVSGCSSINSRLVNWDGEHREWTGKKLKGTPVTVPVQSHVRLTVVDEYWMNSKYVPVTQGRTVKYEPIITQQIYTVDPKRPAAGTIDYDLAARDNYSLKTVDSTIDDKTIEEISAALNRIASAGGLRAALGVSTAAGDATPTPPPAVNPYKDLYRIEETVASQVFEVKDPWFQQKVDDFLAIHLNQPQYEVAGE